MKIRYAILCFGLAVHSASAYEITTVKVGGNEKQAEVFFQVSQEVDSLPQLEVSDGIAELTFGGAELMDSFHKKLDLSAPHALLGRVIAYDAAKGTVKVKVVVNGDAENLKGRVHVSKEGQGFRLRVDYPRKESPALALLKEEQAPMVAAPAAPKTVTTHYPTAQLLLVALVMAMAGVATYFVVRFLRTKGQLRGSRKYLIEQLSYCPMGAKSGVGLLKVGSEFILVGVTPNQITMLSALPKLEAQYQDEARFERGAFKQAVDEEMGRIHTDSESAA